MWDWTTAGRRPSSSGCGWPATLRRAQRRPPPQPWASMWRSFRKGKPAASQDMNSNSKTKRAPATRGLSPSSSPPACRRAAPSHSQCSTCRGQGATATCGSSTTKAFALPLPSPAAAAWSCRHACPARARGPELPPSLRLVQMRRQSSLSSTPATSSACAPPIRRAGDACASLPRFQKCPVRHKSPPGSASGPGCVAQPLSPGALWLQLRG